MTMLNSLTLKNTIEAGRYAARREPVTIVDLEGLVRSALEVEGEEQTYGVAIRELVTEACADIDGVNGESLWGTGTSTAGGYALGRLTDPRNPSISEAIIEAIAEPYADHMGGRLEVVDSDLLFDPVDVYHWMHELDEARAMEKDGEPGAAEDAQHAQSQLDLVWADLDQVCGGLRRMKREGIADIARKVIEGRATKYAEEFDALKAYDIAA